MLEELWGLCVVVVLVFGKSMNELPTGLGRVQKKEKKRKMETGKKEKERWEIDTFQQTPAQEGRLLGCFACHMHEATSSAST